MQQPLILIQQPSAICRKKKTAHHEGISTTLIILVIFAIFAVFAVAMSCIYCFVWKKNDNDNSGKNNKKKKKATVKALSFKKKRRVRINEDPEVRIINETSVVSTPVMEDGKNSNSNRYRKVQYFGHDLMRDRVQDVAHRGARCMRLNCCGPMCQGQDCRGKGYFFVQECKNCGGHGKDLVDPRVRVCNHCQRTSNQ